MSNEMLSADLQGSNPKLQSVRYVNVLPEGKQGDYTQNNRVDFQPDPITNPYFDGAQSYLNINVENTSTFNVGNSGIAPANVAATPMCFPAHIGVNAIFNRALLRAKENSQVIEDIEAYNMLSGIKDAYSHDSDVFQALSRITGVSARTCNPMNQTIDNLGVNYFLPNGSSTSNTVTGGSTSVNATFCVPVQTGLFSAFGKDEHHVVPNLDVPLHLQLFLERNNVAMQVMYHKFFKATTVNGVAVTEVYAFNPLDPIEMLATDDKLEVPHSVCDPALTDNEEPYNLNMCVWRPGQLVTNGTDTSQITDVSRVQTGDVSNIVLTLDAAFSTGDGNTNVSLAPITRGYKVNKIELKLLLTIPDPPTMQMIRSQMAQGISFTSVQLYKQSTSAQLTNAVIDIPEALTRAGSILAVPCQQNSLDALDVDNSYMYCRPDALTSDANTNQTGYQWQIQNVLLPNLAVETNTKTNANSDNSIFFNQQVMALRHLINVKALADSPRVRKTQDVDLELPFFYPIALAPRGVSFNLIDSAPQLRLSNTGATTPADITAKLFYIFIVHTRILRASDGGAQIEF